MRRGKLPGRAVLSHSDEAIAGDVAVTEATTIGGDIVCDLGEGPVWDDAGQALWWHDVTGRVLHRLDHATGATRSWPLPKMPGSFGHRRGGGMIAAFRNRLSLFDPETGEDREIEGHGIDFAVERFNDGACDAMGRFWTGTFDPTMKTDRGTLYRIDPDLSVTRVDTGINMSNGIAWSPDGRTLYYSDSRPGQVYRYDFDMESGTIGRRSIFIDFAGREGAPDGCTVDAEGFLWVAEVEAGRIGRYDPAGRCERTIELPVSKPTSVAFGGPDLSTLFVTSMRYGLGEKELARQPAAGRLLAVDVGVKGLPEPLFGG